MNFIKHLTCCVVALATAEATAQTYLECDFSQGIPDDFVLIDNDALTPSKDMQNIGFAIGTPWLVTKAKGDSNSVACSTSWYNPAGQADD